VLVATNDALLVQRAGGGKTSTISVTWRDWQTIVGSVEGDPDLTLGADSECFSRIDQLRPAARTPMFRNVSCSFLSALARVACRLVLAIKWHGMLMPGSCSRLSPGPLARVALQEALPDRAGCRYSGGCCNVVKNVSLAAPATSQFWRWGIEASFDGAGSTICFIGFQIGGRWVTDPSWSVSAAYHPNGPPVGVLTRDCDTFWNADAGPPPTTAAPRFLTIDLKAKLTVTGFQYSICESVIAAHSFCIHRLFAMPVAAPRPTPRVSHDSLSTPTHPVQTIPPKPRRRLCSRPQG